MFDVVITSLMQGLLAGALVWIFGFCALMFFEWRERREAENGMGTHLL